MKALILAAGLGTRLRPLTDKKPKSMVEINGKPILFQQIDNLLENNVNDIIIISGYQSEVMINAINEAYRNHQGIKVIINEDFDKTNNMYSAYLAMDHMYDNEFLLMNADVFHDSSVIKELMKNEYANSIVTEEGAYNEESMKIVFDGEKIQEISKQIAPSNAYGTSINIYKFSKEGSNIFYDKVKDYIVNMKELNQWTEVALNEILKTTNFKPCPLKGRWMEIDNHEDLKKAESLFNE